MSRQALIIENIALRSQLAICQQDVTTNKRPKRLPTPAFRQLWVMISRYLVDWQSALMVVKPQTVINWHRTAFRWYWARKSIPPGRPSISRSTIILIKRIHRENSLWSPERIHDQMVALGIIDTPSPNTIAKYIPATRKPPSERTQQSWKTFIANHMDTTWAMDFCVVPTLTFHVLYVFIVISHARRKIVHIAVTKQPTMAWTAQQLREATPFGEQPKYLIRDNDSIYGKDVLDFIAAARIEGVRTAYRSPWQNPFVERLTGILRRELLDHIIPLDERHLERLLREFVENYYHPIRTHSGLDCEPPLLDSSVNKPILLDSAELDSQPILGGLYHGYHAKAA